MHRGFKSQAERIALDQRQVLSLRDFDPLPARSIADQLCVSVITPHQIPEITPDLISSLLQEDASWSAISFSRNGCKVIIYNPVHSKKRQESDIMHEIAHFLCNHEPSTIQKIKNFPPVRTYDRGPPPIKRTGS